MNFVKKPINLGSSNKTQGWEYDIFSCAIDRRRLSSVTMSLDGHVGSVGTTKGHTRMDRSYEERMLREERTMRWRRFRGQSPFQTFCRPTNSTRRCKQSSQDGRGGGGGGGEEGGRERDYTRTNVANFHRASTLLIS